MNATANAAQREPINISAAGCSGSDGGKAAAFPEQAPGQLTAQQRQPERGQRNRRKNQPKAGV